MGYQDDWSRDYRNTNFNNNRGGNNRSRGNGNGYRGESRKKHSGCKSGTDKNGKPYIQGWKYDKTNGLRRFYASPYSGTKQSTSGSGKVWENWFVRVQLPNGQEMKTSGLFDKQQNKISIPQLGFVMNPRGGAGGYVGPYYFKRNR